jgi:hypothetical protein
VFVIHLHRGNVVSSTCTTHQDSIDQLATTVWIIATKSRSPTQPRCHARQHARQHSHEVTLTNTATAIVSIQVMRGALPHGRSMLHASSPRSKAPKLTNRVQKGDDRIRECSCTSDTFAATPKGWVERRETPSHQPTVLPNQFNRCPVGGLVVCHANHKHLLSRDWIPQSELFVPAQRSEK